MAQHDAPCADPQPGWLSPRGERSRSVKGSSSEPCLRHTAAEAMGGFRFGGLDDSVEPRASDPHRHQRASSSSSLASPSRSSFAGPKCFSMTRDSVPLTLLIVTPSRATDSDTKNSSSVNCP